MFTEVLCTKLKFEILEAIVLRVLVNVVNVVFFRYRPVSTFPNSAVKPFGALSDHALVVDSVTSPS